MAGKYPVCGVFSFRRYSKFLCSLSPKPTNCQNRGAPETALSACVAAVLASGGPSVWKITSAGSVAPDASCSAVTSSIARW